MYSAQEELIKSIKNCKNEDAEAISHYLLKCYNLLRINRKGYETIIDALENKWEEEGKEGLDNEIAKIARVSDPIERELKKWIELLPNEARNKLYNKRVYYKRELIHGNPEGNINIKETDDEWLYNSMKLFRELAKNERTAIGAESLYNLIKDYNKYGPTFEAIMRTDDGNIKTIDMAIESINNDDFIFKEQLDKVYNYAHHATYESQSLVEKGKLSMRNDLDSALKLYKEIPGSTLIRNRPINSYYIMPNATEQEVKKTLRQIELAHGMDKNIDLNPFAQLINYDYNREFRGYIDNKYNLSMINKIFREYMDSKGLDHKIKINEKDKIIYTGIWVSCKEMETQMKMEIDELARKTFDDPDIISIFKNIKSSSRNGEKYDEYPLYKFEDMRDVNVTCAPSGIVINISYNDHRSYVGQMFNGNVNMNNSAIINSKNESANFVNKYKLSDNMSGAEQSNMVEFAENNPPNNVLASEYYKSYIKYCETRKINPVSSQMFYKNIKKLNISKKMFNGRHYYEKRK